MEDQNYIDNSESSNSNGAQKIENNNIGGYAIALQDLRLIVGDPEDQNNKWLNKESEKKDDVIKKHLKNIAPFL